jgi:hypothetical protein
MPPRRKKAGGLTEDDVTRLRGQLSEGRRPRVALSGPQFEAGATGTVVRIGDPSADGADFLTVRVKVNGVTDELAFAPGELSIGRGGASAGGAGSARTGSAGGRTRAGQSRAAGQSPAAVKAGAAVSKPAAVSKSAAAGPTPPGPTAPAAGHSEPPTSAADRTPSPAASSPAGAGSASPTAAPAKAAASVAKAAASVAKAAGAATTQASRRRKAPAAPTVNLTISSTGASWSVSASRGARTIIKNVPVAPGVVTAIAELLAQAGLSEAVAEINETARQQAQQRAEELRAELSDLEAVLATHQAPR